MNAVWTFLHLDDSVHNLQFIVPTQNLVFCKEKVLV